MESDAQTRHWPRLGFGRFSLSSLLIAMAIASVLLTWAVRSPNAVVRAQLQVKANPRPLIGEPPPFSPQEYADFRRAVVGSIRSDTILNRALRNPRIAGLGPLQSASDPTAWLQNNLIVDLPADSEIMTVALKGSERDQDDLSALLDAVVTTFLEEQVSYDRQKSELLRNAKVRAAEELAQTIQRQEDQGKVDDSLKLLRQKRLQLIAEARQDEINLGSEQRVTIFRPVEVIADRVPRPSE